VTPTRAYVGLGSNLAQPRRQIAKALARIDAVARTRVLRVSRSYLTAPIGGVPQPDYVNAVALVCTTLSPRALLRQLHAIERRQHRRRDAATPRNARRLRSPQLTLPHPRMHERAFVLKPLTDIMPAATIPGRGLARRLLARTRGQRIERTRTHFPRNFRASPTD
jgi:2-amino-4-hydroxy-6-hydroxymethyldihydropteridine diphosphokinase